MADNKRTHGKGPKKKATPKLAGAIGSARGEAAAIWTAIGKLKPWQANPRLNAKAVPAVAASIMRFGFGAPIIVREADMEVIAGHTRLAAAVLLGMTMVPVRWLDLPAGEAHAMALADNKIGELAEWEEKLLGDILAEQKELGTDLITGTGLEVDEVARLVEESNRRKIDSAPAPGGGDPNQATGAAVLVFRNRRILLTDQEAQRFDDALKQYTKDVGSTFGFAGRMVEGL